ncbi:MAG: hypothetical protein ACRCX2_22370 [Paraclostridium sp.]
MDDVIRELSLCEVSSNGFSMVVKNASKSYFQLIDNRRAAGYYGVINNPYINAFAFSCFLYDISNALSYEEKSSFPLQMQNCMMKIINYINEIVITNISNTKEEKELRSIMCDIFTHYFCSKLSDTDENSYVREKNYFLLLGILGIHRNVDDFIRHLPSRIKSIIYVLYDKMVVSKETEQIAKLLPPIAQAIQEK